MRTKLCLYFLLISFITCTGVEEWVPLRLRDGYNYDLLKSRKGTSLDRQYFEEWSLRNGKNIIRFDFDCYRSSEGVVEFCTPNEWVVSPDTGSVFYAKLSNESTSVLTMLCHRKTENKITALSYVNLVHSVMMSDSHEVVTEYDLTRFGEEVEESYLLKYETTIEGDSILNYCVIRSDFTNVYDISLKVPKGYYQGAEEMLFRYIASSVNINGRKLWNNLIASDFKGISFRID